MSENKIPPERVTELLGYRLVKVYDKDGGEVPEDFYWVDDRLQNRMLSENLPNFHTDPAWTGPLLERLREKCKGKYKLEIVFNSLGTCFVIRSTLSAELVYHQNDEAINTVLIEALDTLEKERQNVEDRSKRIPESSR